MKKKSEPKLKQVKLPDQLGQTQPDAPSKNAAKKKPNVALGQS